MPQFKKRPIIIEAVQFMGNYYLEGINIASISHEVPWMKDNQIPYQTGTIPEGKWCVSGNRLVIGTKEGNLFASKEDWIIRGIQGEIYPCKPDIFYDTYEGVEE